MYSAAVLTIIAGPSMGTVAELATPRAAAQAEEQNLLTPPDETTIHIHKLQGADFSNNSKGIENENGEEQSFEQLRKHLGVDVKGLSNVTFMYYKVSRSGLEKYKTFEELQTIQTIEAADEAVKAGYLEEGKKTLTTNNDGLIDVKLSSKHKETYLFLEMDRPTNVSSSVGVPFVVSLPLANSNGKTYLDSVHIYPKNVTGDTPKIDKDVTKLGNDDDSYTIGEEIKWYLKSTIPGNVADYTKFKFTDKLDDSLNFLKNKESSVGKVYFGNKELVKNQDYNLTFQNNREISIELTSDGIKNIASYIKLNKEAIKLIESEEELYKIESNTDQQAFLSVELKAVLNDKAVLGKRIPNNFELEYTRKSDKENKLEKVPNKEVPEVHTGGRIFKKVDALNKADNGLEGAEFALYFDKELNQPVTWTEDLIKANKKGIEEGKFKADSVKANQQIIFKSDTNGVFEIKGLAYGNKGEKSRPNNSEGSAEQTGSTSYFIKEQVAPAGYVISQKVIEFEVNDKSYYKNPQSISSATIAGDADPQKVENTKRPAIPNTGGIGTAIFIAIGAVVMVFAARGMKGHNKDK